MKADDLIHRKRNSAFSIKVGDPNDMTPIGDMFSTGDDLYVIKSKTIYLVKLADDIDPDRTNHNLPNSQKTVLNHGLENEIVGRVLLTAKTLFDRIHLGPNFNYNSALSNAFELTKMLTEMQDIYTDLELDLDQIIQQELRTVDEESLRLLTTSKLEARIETFIRKADQVRGIILAYLKLIYNAGTNKKIIENLYSDIVTKHGEESGLAKFVENITLFLTFLRNMRNGIEHPKDDHRASIIDFSLAPNGTVNPPSLELINKETPQPKILITLFMEQVTSQLIDVVEYLMAHLCISNMGYLGDFECGIIELPPERRRHKNVRFSYAIKIQGQWQPLG